jgi:hypothetical protein
MLAMVGGRRGIAGSLAARASDQPFRIRCRYRSDLTLGCSLGRVAMSLECDFLSNLGNVRRLPPDSAMERIPLKRRRRGGRRKGEQSFVMLGMPALRDVLETSDIDAMLSKLASMQIWPHVSGFDERRSFTVMAHEFPAELYQRAVEAAGRDDGWHGFFDRKE